MVKEVDLVERKWLLLSEEEGMSACQCEKSNWINIIGEAQIAMLEFLIIFSYRLEYMKIYENSYLSHSL